MGSVFSEIPASAPYSVHMSVVNGFHVFLDVLRDAPYGQASPFGVQVHAAKVEADW